MGVEGYSQRVYGDGDVIFGDGSRGGEAYLIKSGQVRLWKNEAGKPVTIALIGKGKIFGEMAVISDMPRMASASAVGEVTCVSIDRPELHRRLDELKDHQKAALNFLIYYCGDFLPYELHDKRPTDAETRKRDDVARNLIAKKDDAPITKDLDPILSGLYQALVGYAQRRVPPA